MYIARIYEKIVNEKNIYGKKKIPLPRPEFFVLYNGVDPYPDTATLRLADAFGDAASLGLSNTLSLSLDLTVKILNINQGHNEPMVKQSKWLKGYSAFIAKVREYGQGADSKETTMKRAIQYCIRNGILKEFLERNGSEVSNMLLTEWNWDDAKEVWQAEARDEGIEQGLESKAFEVAKNLINRGQPPEDVAEITGLDLEAIKALVQG
jgi:hypothetical protein